MYQPKRVAKSPPPWPGPLTPAAGLAPGFVRLSPPRFFNRPPPPYSTALLGVGVLLSKSLSFFGVGGLGWGLVLTFSGDGIGTASSGGTGALGCGATLYIPLSGSNFGESIAGGCGMGIPALGTIVTLMLCPTLPPTPDHWSPRILR